MQDALILSGLEAIGPQSSVLGIGLNKLDLLGLTTCQGQIVNRLLIDIKHGRRRTILGRHI